MSDDEESTYDLVMPFVTVTSKGGPHEDVAYTAGWSMGALDALLEYSGPAIHEDTIYSDSVPQADRIAMKHLYRADFVPGPDGWSFMTLTRDVPGTLEGFVGGTEGGGGAP